MAEYKFEKIETSNYKINGENGIIGTVKIYSANNWRAESNGVTTIGKTRREATEALLAELEIIGAAKVAEPEEAEERRLTIMDYKEAEKNGISNRLAYQRFYENGWSREETINREKGERGLYKRWKPVIDLVKIKRQTFYTRVFSEGMTPFEACITPVGKPKGRKRGNGKLTEDHIQLAIRRGIPRGTVNQRVYAYKWDVEKAISKKVETKFRKKAARA